MRLASNAWLLFAATFFVLSVSSVRGQEAEGLFAALPLEIRPGFESKVPASILNNRAGMKFSNPVLFRFEDGCTPANLKSRRFANGMSSAQRILFCRAFQTVSNELNRTNWSPALRTELQNIWRVFMNENVKIRPMRRGVSNRIPLAAEPFTRGRASLGFSASIYIRPKYASKKSFFLMAMHELRHIYDFHQLWEAGAALPEAELEKRGFRIMGRIARETVEKEKFKRLPKVWKDSWKMYAEAKIKSKMESTIEKFLGKSSFYKDRMRKPNLYMVSYVNRGRSQDRSYQASLRKPKTKRSAGSGIMRPNPVKKTNNHVPLEHPELTSVTALSSDTIAAIPSVPLTESQKAGRLPDMLNTKPADTEVEPTILTGPFSPELAKNKKSSEDLLRAAITNERNLYYKMNDFVYDEDFQLQCYKKQKVTETYKRNRSVARDNEGQPIFRNENVIQTPVRKKSRAPSCLLNPAPINSDASETFWSAAYLGEMPIKFNYFTKLNGQDVARYTVYKPAPVKFKEIAAKYPHIKSFRVFYGTIFISVDDSQIVKFWGSTYPQSETTGHHSGETLANYNSTAIRNRLRNGIWVTATLSTVAVAKKRGKMRPFSYIVKYLNYRKSTQEEKEEK